MRSVQLSLLSEAARIVSQLSTSINIDMFRLVKKTASSIGIHVMKHMKAIEVFMTR